MPNITSGGFQVIGTNGVVFEVTPDGHVFVNGQDITSAPGIIGTSYTVGNAGSGAKYTSPDQTAFNTATAAAIAAGVGEVEVLPGTLIKPTAEVLLTGTKMKFTFGRGSLIQLQAGVRFDGSIVGGGALTWTSVAVAANLVDSEVYGLTLDTLNTVTSTVSGLNIAGGCYRVTFYNQTSTNFPRWARSLTGYRQMSVAGGSAIYDGGCDGVTFYSPRSDNCGSNGIPDGGGLKLFNGCTAGVGVGTLKNIREYDPRDTNVGFSCLDMNPQNAVNGAYFQNYERFGGYGHVNNDEVVWNPPGAGGIVAPRPGKWAWSVTAAANADIVLTWTGQGGSSSTLVSGAVQGTTYTGQFTVTTTMVNVGNLFTLSNVSAFPTTGNNRNGIFQACFAIFIEAAYPAAASGVNIFGGEYDCLGNGYGDGNIGLSLGLQNRHVQVYSTIFRQADVGWSVQGVALAMSQGGDFTLDGLKSLRCATAAKVVPNGGGAGNSVDGLRVMNCIGDDEGSGVMSVGLNYAVSTTKPALRTIFSNCDFSRVAPGGSVLTGSSSLVSQGGVLFKNCKGISDVGLLATPFGTTTVNEIRVNGTSTGANTANPAANVAYRVMDPNVTVQSTGGTSTITVTMPDNSILQLSDAAIGTTGTPTASVWYLLTSAQVWTVAGGTGVAVTAIGPDGTVYLAGGATATNVALPSGTLVTLGAFTVAPTVTVQGIATPFLALSTVATLPNATTIPKGATINWVTFSASTVVVKYNGTTVVDPFMRYRECSFAGAAASPSTGLWYEVIGTAIILQASGATGLQFADPQGNLIASGLTGATMLRIEPGYRIQWVTTVGTVAVYTAP